ncbi:hypothetical protein PsorP6_014011 [Peronosclerospora sorghi]|uniref:Uncharacterized protein n=1 Tax=Peronosclerospora sorghi TaxID=230839 RepID=A0ACC0VIG9_9STRA|nr:hypothetical protein PsorP6_014011 [Peronosclerospora sorghi]
MEHSVCFVPGMFALNYMNGIPEDHLPLSKRLFETCFRLYAQRNKTNILRPETVDSLIVLYRVTKDEKYREYGRETMMEMKTNYRLERGEYASIGNVTKRPFCIGFRDGRERFFLAETLKYLFLLFSIDSMLALDDVVVNTRGHLFPM